MRRRSLYFRLGLASTILVALALALAALGLHSIFHQEIERRAANELTNIVKSIAAQASVDSDGAPILDLSFPDPRFEIPYGGLYWQVARADGRNARSRSLWDYELTIPHDDAANERRVVSLDGPNGTRLLAVTQKVLVPAKDGQDTTLWIAAALDREDIAASQRSFLHLLALSLAALGVILIASMAVFLRLALKPFRTLARELQAIHGGASRVLGGDFPTEVQGVVDDLNRLIAFQDRAVDRAKSQAGDLAHGLKTPLAILSAIGRQAGDAGRKDLAQPIEEQVGQMRRQVDRVLARARAGAAAALGRQSIPVEPVARKVIRAFETLTDDKALRFETHLSADARFPGQADDLTEVLGNLIDNARKWAKTRVRLVASVERSRLLIHVDDDGPGLAPEHASQIMRGRRWDENKPGTGFGLAITQELAEAYQGTLALDRSDLGGLRASLAFPLRAAPPP